MSLEHQTILTQTASVTAETIGVDPEKVFAQADRQWEGLHSCPRLLIHFHSLKVTRFE